MTMQIVFIIFYIILYSTHACWFIHGCLLYVMTFYSEEDFPSGYRNKYILIQCTFDID